MNSDTERRARAAYDAVATPKPDWDQLGDVTKGVWRKRVRPSPPLRKEIALSLNHMPECYAGRAGAVSMSNGANFIVLAACDEDLDEAVRRLASASGPPDRSLYIDGLLFDARHVNLDDEI